MIYLALSILWHTKINEKSYTADIIKIILAASCIEMFFNWAENWIYNYFGTYSSIIFLLSKVISSMRKFLNRSLILLISTGFEILTTNHIHTKKIKKYALIVFPIYLIFNL